MKFRRSYFLFLFLVLFVIAWTVLLFSFTPQEIVQAIGVENAYLAIFLLALLGGLSSVTGFSFYAAVATLAVGGAEPWILGLAGGAGLFLSDSVFYYLAHHGLQLLSGRWEQRAQWARTKIDPLPRWAVFGGTYLYTGFAPLPNDILMVVLALSRYPYMQLAAFIAAGSITHVTLISYLARVGFSF